MKIIVLAGIVSILLVSCAPKSQVIEKPVYLKCQIPEVPKSDLEVVNLDDLYPVKLEKILNNCSKIKRENELLREAIKFCQ